MITEKTETREGFLRQATPISRPTVTSLPLRTNWGSNRPVVDRLASLRRAILDLTKLPQQVVQTPLKAEGVTPLGRESLYRSICDQCQ